MADDIAESQGSQDFPTSIRRVVESARKSGNRALNERFSEANTQLGTCVIDSNSPEYGEAIDELQDWIIEAIQSTDVFAAEPPYSTESKPSISSEEKAKIVTTKEQGLALLSKISEGQSPAPQEGPPALIACLASFTDPKDPWTSPKSHCRSQDLLSTHLQTLKTNPSALQSLILTILHDHIKPLFAKNPLLTPAGRKALHPSDNGNTSTSTDFEHTTKPWKFHSPHIITVFQWTLSVLTPSMLETNWHLISPPLLTILDDISTAHKINGCLLLGTLCKTASANLLARTGLGELIHETLMPYLLYLPSLTPEDESLPLLNAAYDALLTLTHARFPKSDTDTISDNQTSHSDDKERVHTLSTIFNYGILPSHAHCPSSDHPLIATLLFQKTTSLVSAMGVYASKHLTHLLPLISATLTHPFALSYPPLLMAALGTLGAVVRAAWPTLSKYRGNVLEGLCVLWVRIQDEPTQSKEVRAVGVEMERVVRGVVGVLKGAGDEGWEREVGMLGSCDERLEVILRG